jgi:hypothetical protein
MVGTALPLHVRGPTQLAAVLWTDSAYAVQAEIALISVYVPDGLQSKYESPTPSEWVVWHAGPQHPGVAHSQPSVSGAVVLQSERPAAQT